MNKKIIVFDTTLRDGAQSEKVSFSLEDKLKIIRILVDLGIDYIEAGWPGSNPKDYELFQNIKNNHQFRSKIVAFCSTRKKNIRPETDRNLLSVIESEVKTAALFGKSSVIHVEQVLKTSKAENLKMIYDSVSFLTKKEIKVIYDAEHFFDGYKLNRNYALECLQTAAKAGAVNLTLCDTNGGCLPAKIKKIVGEIKKRVKTPLGIHAHNDGGLALANTIESIENGVSMVQGTINGYGERCGNADLTSVIPTLQLKMGYNCIPGKSLKKIILVSKELSEIVNENPNNQQPYVGKSAFAHKGGIHVSAVQRCKSSYEHIDPEKIGNKTRVIISELSGKSNIQEKLKEWGVVADELIISKILKKIKDLENKGYSFENADGTLRLLYERMKNKLKPLFQTIYYHVEIAKGAGASILSQATVIIKVGDKTITRSSSGDGPVNALDRALRKAITPFFPKVNQVELIDYKVRIPNDRQGTAAKTRVLITSKNHHEIWTTIGASANIIDASWHALVDSIEYYLSQSN